MPIYEYEREDGSRFETMQSIKDDALEIDPETGQKCKRIITGGSSVIFKGNGFPSKYYRSVDRHMKNPHETTLPEYNKVIKENTERAIELNNR